MVADFEIYVPLEGLIDFDKERTRLEKNKAEIEAGIQRDEERLLNPDFRSRAPADKVADVETRLAESKAQLSRITHFLRALGK